MAARKENPPGVDELYGLEPVFEPGAGEAADIADAASVRTQAVRCPYCGETFEAVVDLSSGSTSYIEDCQVCCRPIEFRLEVGAEGSLVSLETHRSD